MHTTITTTHNATKKNTRRALKLIAGATAIAVLASACGSDNDSSPNGEAQTGAADDTAADQVEPADTGSATVSQESSTSGSAAFDDRADDEAPGLSSTVFCGGPGQSCSHELSFSGGVAADGGALALHPGQGHCSPVTLELLAEERLVGSAYFYHGDPTASAVFPIDGEGETVDFVVRATGHIGGCNGGELGSWGVEIRPVDVDLDPASDASRPRT